MKFANQKGQTVVEYILLFAVATSLVVTFYRSATYKKLFGEQGQLAALYKLEAEWGYRHAYIMGKESGAQYSQYDSIQLHPSYFNKTKGESRFFGPSDAYP